MQPSQQASQCGSQSGRQDRPVSVLVFVKVCGEFVPLCEVWYIINTRLYLLSHETVTIFVYIMNFIVHYVLGTCIIVYDDRCTSCLQEIYNYVYVWICVWFTVCSRPAILQHIFYLKATNKDIRE